MANLRVQLTQIPQLNSIVIRQSGGHFFIAAQDSIIIDRAGLIQLILELVKVGFIEYADLEAIAEELYYGKDEDEN